MSPTAAKTRKPAVTKEKKGRRDAAGPCPTCGTDRLPDADGKPVCPSCPLPFVTDRLALYRRAVKSPGLDTFDRMRAVLGELADLAERFAGEITDPDTALGEFVADLDDADGIAAELRTAVKFAGDYLDVAGSVLPARTR